MSFRRPVLIALPLALAATTLTACREAPAPTPAPPTPATSGTPTGTASGTSGPGSAPTPQPIAGSSIPFTELAPTVGSAQNAQGTFRFTLQAGEETVLGSARCIAPLAWQAKSPGFEEVHVDGKEYRRSIRRGETDFRVSEDEDLTLTGDNPCNPAELVPSRERNSLVFHVVSRDATSEGRSGLTQLRASAPTTDTTYTFWVEPSRRPVRFEVTKRSKTQWISYHDYGSPVSILAPTNIRTHTYTRPPTPRPCDGSTPNPSQASDVQLSCPQPPTPSGGAA